ncbi:MAG: hypothetical protein QM778_37515 [Myxococcales bacterium]
MRWLRTLLASFGTSALVAAPLAAQDTAQEQADSGEERELDVATSRTYVNARVGLASTDENGMPEVCMEGAPLAYLSVEACGTGAQLWHNRPQPEMSHYRVKGRVLSHALRGFWLQGFVGVGMAELSVGADDPGFALRGVSAERTSTAGAELTLSTRALIPLKRGFDLLGDLAVAGAYLPHADELFVSRLVFQPSFSLSLGVGF